MKQIFTAIITLVIFAACNMENSTSTVFKVDANSSSDAAAQQLEPKVEVTLVKLQLPDSIVFNANSSMIKPSSHGFVAYEYNGKRFLIFDEKGLFIREISRNGQGPEEYSRVIDYVVSDDNLYILDVAKILVYDLGGNYLFTFPANGSRGKITADNKRVFVQHAFNNDSLLTVYNSDGSLKGNLLPSREELTKFQVPSGPEISTLGRYQNGIYISRVLDNTIYYLNDTVLEPLAIFDFGAANVNDDVFTGTPEAIEAKFHSRRNENAGLAYYDCLLISDNWIVLSPEGVKDTKLVMADRRTGETYTDEALPEVVKSLLGRRLWFWSYDKAADSFVRMVSGDIVAEAIANSDNSIITNASELDDINEENDDFIMLFHLR